MKKYTKPVRIRASLGIPLLRRKASELKPIRLKPKRIY